MNLMIRYKIFCLVNMHILLVLRFFYLSAKGQKCAENSDIRFYLVKFTSKVSEVIIFLQLSETRRIRPI